MLCNPALSVSEQVVSQRYYTPSPDKENLPTLFPLRLPNNLKIREHTKIQFCKQENFSTTNTSSSKLPVNRLVFGQLKHFLGIGRQGFTVKVRISIMSKKCPFFFHPYSNFLLTKKC